MGISIVAALLSAALFAVTTNLQREAASAVPEQDAGPLRLIRRLLTDRRWLLAGGVGVAALALHVVALSRNGVLAVQAVMTLGLVLALALEARRSRRRLLPRELGGAVLIGLGVVVVVAVSRPATSAQVREPVVALACAAVVLAALALVVRSRHGVGGTARARLLAAAAGACFAVDAVFLQRAAQALHVPPAAAGDAVAAVGRTVAVSGPASLSGPAPLAGLPLVGGLPGPALLTVVIGTLGFLVASAVGGLAVQRAYQAAPLRCVQPAVAAAEPVTAFVVGITVLSEGVRGGTLGAVLLVAGLAALVVGIVAGVTPSGVLPAAAPADPVAQGVGTPSPAGSGPSRELVTAA